MSKRIHLKTGAAVLWQLAGEILILWFAACCASCSRSDGPVNKLADTRHVSLAAQSSGGSEARSVSPVQDIAFPPTTEPVDPDSLYHALRARWQQAGGVDASPYMTVYGEQRVLLGKLTSRLTDDQLVILFKYYAPLTEKPMGYFDDYLCDLIMTRTLGGGLKELDLTTVLSVVCYDEYQLEYIEHILERTRGHYFQLLLDAYEKSHSPFVRGKIVRALARAFDGQVARGTTSESDFIERCQRWYKIHAYRLTLNPDYPESRGANAGGLWETTPEIPHPLFLED